MTQAVVARRSVRKHPRFLSRALALALAGTIAGSALAQQAPVALTASEDNRFENVYPGVWTPREKSVVEAYLKANAALRQRGPIDVKALVAGTLPADTPGLGPVIKVTEDWLRYNAQKYALDNPLYNDKAYALKAGLPGLPAFPTFATHDDTFMVPFPPAARDKLLVSELNHDVRSLAPIYAGDTLFMVMDSREMIDLTPVEGSTYRSVAINSTGSIYNQRGEKVNEVTFRVVESVRHFINPADAPANPGFMDIWVAPDWLQRPAHVYTDQDWARIRQIWSGEKVRGATPLYWEDVKVGDRPAPTLEGPIEASVSPVPPWGMGVGGSRTLKREITDPAIFKTMIRGEKDGIWRMPARNAAVPVPPALPGNGQSAQATGAIDTTNIHKDGVKRSPLVNYFGRDMAIRHFNAWMGDKGRLARIRWSIMDPRSFPAYGFTVPANPAAEHFLDEVPALRGRHVEAHGVTQDVALIQSEVVSRYVQDGHFMVDLVWWIETIDGTIWEEGKTTVELPSRR